MDKETRIRSTYKFITTKAQKAKKEKKLSQRRRRRRRKKELSQRLGRL